MKYIFNVLRNEKPVDSYDSAINVLNNFDKHLIGQPLSILYNDDNGNVQTVFAIGLKNYTDVADGELTYGKDFYQIINEKTFDFFWKYYSNGELTTSKEVINIIKSDSIDDEALRDERNIVFTNDSIYVGGKLYGSNLLNNLIFDSVEFEGDATFETVYSALIDKINNAKSKWVSVDDLITQEVIEEDDKIVIDTPDDENNIQFVKLDKSEYDKIENKYNYIYKANSELKKGENIILNREAVYVGDTLIGDAYVSNERLDAVIPKEVGGIKAGQSLEDIYKSTNGSISKVLDAILFPEIEPTIIQPSVSISIKRNTPIERGDKGFVASDFIGEVKLGTVSRARNINDNSIVENVDYSGGLSNMPGFILNGDTSLNEGEGKESPEILKDKEYKVKFRANFRDGINQPITSKGNNFGEVFGSKTIDSKEITIKTYLPVLAGINRYGFSTISNGHSTMDDLFENNEHHLNKKEIKITSTGEIGYFIFAIPEGEGYGVKNIIDSNGFDVTNTYEKIESFEHPFDAYYPDSNLGKLGNLKWTVYCHYAPSAPAAGYYEKITLTGI